MEQKPFVEDVPEFSCVLFPYVFVCLLEATYFGTACTGLQTKRRTNSEQTIAMFGFSEPISGTQKQGTFWALGQEISQNYQCHLLKPQKEFFNSSKSAGISMNMWESFAGNSHAQQITEFERKCLGGNPLWLLFLADIFQISAGGIHIYIYVYIYICIYI